MPGMTRLAQLPFVVENLRKLCLFDFLGCGHGKLSLADRVVAIVSGESIHVTALAEEELRYIVRVGPKTLSEASAGRVPQSRLEELVKSAACELERSRGSAHAESSVSRSVRSRFTLGDVNGRSCILDLCLLPVSLKYFSLELHACIALFLPCAAKFAILMSIGDSGQSALSSLPTDQLTITQLLDTLDVPPFQRFRPAAGTLEAFNACCESLFERMAWRGVLYVYISCHGERVCASGSEPKLRLYFNGGEEVWLQDDILPAIQQRSVC
jgi:hypothetical protein